MAMMTDRPLFPPDAVCVCGCPGRDHYARWEADAFKGTKCDAHGGHKFALGRQGALVQEPPGPNRDRCRVCGHEGLVDGACPQCGAGTRPARPVVGRKGRERIRKRGGLT